MIAQIPGFWPLVLEQAPPDIDEYIQPTDSNLLLNHLTSLSVSHFEVENGGNGDPRSVAIRWEFSDNEYLDDRVIEKKFWYRRSPKDNWSGLVSEPVEIKWKEGKDLTEGLLGLAKAVWDEEQAAGANGAKAKAKTLTDKQKALKAKIDTIGLGGLSFFTWFGYRGERISAAESRIAIQEEKDRRQRRAAGEEVASPTNNDDDEEEQEEEDNSLEIFPTGDQLALAISDDLWPGAIKYFSKFSMALTSFSRRVGVGTDDPIATAQENDDDLSDANFESDEDIEDASLPGTDDESERPSKKRKA
jgi:hypothetical protein